MTAATGVDRKPRLRRAVPTLLLAVLTGAAAAPASAADGLQLGPVRALPVLEVRLTHDDNLFLTSSGERADWVTTVAPALRLELPVRRFTLRVEGGLELVRYREYDEENATNWSAGASVGAEFPGGLSFELADRHEQTYLPGTQEYGEGEDSSRNTATGKVAFQIRDALRLEVEGGRTAYRYDLSDSRRRDEQRVQGDLFWRFLPRTSVFAEVGHTAFDYLDQDEQDGAATHAALGLTWVVTARSTGTVKAGLERKTYDTEDAAAGREDTDTWIVAGSLHHLFTRRTAATLDFSRGTEESDFPDNPYFVQTTAGAALTQRFTAKLYGRLGGRYERHAYPNATSYDNPFDALDALETGERTDTVLHGVATLGFDVLDWLNLELAWDARRRTSTFETFEYDDNRVSLAVTAAF